MRPCLNLSRVNQDHRPDSRVAGRRRVLLTACLVIPEGFLTVPCAIKDISERGARLKLPAAQAIPNEVMLITGREPFAYRAEVAWRRLPEVGVRFVGFIDLKTPETSDGRILRRIWLEMLAR